MKRLSLNSKFVMLICMDLIFLICLTGCETLKNINEVHDSEKRDKIISFNQDAYIRPFISLALDTQGYVAIDEVKGVPQSLATAQGEVIVSRSVEPPPMIDLRFAKGGIETRITDRTRLDFYVDTAFLFGNCLTGEIKSNSHTGPSNFGYEEYGYTEPGYTVGFTPLVTPGFNAELLYFVSEDGRTFMMLGGRYRKFNLEVLQGGWYWGEGSPGFGGGIEREFDTDSKTTIADIYERSIYIGIGTFKYTDNEKNDGSFHILEIFTAKIGLIFNDIDVKNEWKNYLKIDHDYPAVFGGIDIEFRF